MKGKLSNLVGLFIKLQFLVGQIVLQDLKAKLLHFTISIKVLFKPDSGFIKYTILCIFFMEEGLEINVRAHALHVKTSS